MDSHLSPCWLEPTGEPASWLQGQYSYHEGEGRAPPRLIAFAVLIDICRASIFSTLPNHFYQKNHFLPLFPLSREQCECSEW